VTADKIVELPRSAAARPEVRTVTLSLPEPYAGWTFTARTDYPARVLEDLTSDNIFQVARALNLIVLEHNFPDINGNVAGDLMDVDPVGGIIAALGEYNRSRKVPNE
jgi:hypothetical protein